MKKRIVSAILSIIIALTMLPGNVAYAAEEFTIFGENVTAASGEKISVDIILENNPGISAINLYYIYDTDYFKLDRVENKATWFTMTHVTTTVWDAVYNYTEEGTLGTLHLSVAENTPAGEYEIEIVFMSASNDMFEEVTVQTMSATITIKEKDIQIGDANGDGEIDFSDAVLVLEYSAFLIDDSQIDLSACDVNDDGAVDFSDAVLILEYSAFLITEFPAAK